MRFPTNLVKAVAELHLIFGFDALSKLPIHDNGPSCLVGVGATRWALFVLGAKSDLYEGEISHIYLGLPDGE